MAIEHFKVNYPMTDPAGAGIYANMTERYIDGIHGTPDIAAPWILWAMELTLRLLGHFSIANSYYPRHPRFRPHDAAW